MLTLSREADYAVRLVVHMAASSQQRYQARTLAREERIPESFLIKILQLLIRYQIVRSFRGVRGGYQLAIKPSELTLYRLVEVVEGPIGLNVCVTPGTRCELQPRCAVTDVWAVAQAEFRKTLEETTIAELALRAQEKRRRLLPDSLPDNPGPSWMARQSNLEQKELEP